MVCVFTWLGYRGLFHHSSGYCLFGHFFILFVLIWFRQVNHTHADPSLWTTIWVLWNLGLVCFFFLLLVVERNWYFYAINWAKAFKMLNNYIVFKIYIINIYIYIYIFTFILLNVLFIESWGKKKDATFSRLIINVSWAPNHIIFWQIVWHWRLE